MPSPVVLSGSHASAAALAPLNVLIDSVELIPPNPRLLREVAVHCTDVKRIHSLPLEEDFPPRMSWPSSAS